MTITSVPTSKAPTKSKYFKSSTYCPQNILDSTTKDFQFGFAISGENTDSSGGHENSADDSSPLAASNAVSENYYHMDMTGNTGANGNAFAFNFDIPEAGNS